MKKKNLVLILAGCFVAFCLLSEPKHVMQSQAGDGPQFPLEETSGQPEQIAATPLELPDFSAKSLPMTHAVRVQGTDSRGQSITSSGACVAMGGDKFATVSHLIAGINRPVISVAVDGEWKPARLQSVIPGKDYAVLTVPGVDLPTIQTCEPAYLERVKVTGFASDKTHYGILSDTINGTISLDADDTGIVRGDSGGAVVSEGGELIGVIRAYAGADPNSDRRIVHFEPIPLPPRPVMKSAQPEPAKPEQTQPAAPNCANGQCGNPATYQPQRRGLFGRIR